MNPCFEPSYGGPSDLYRQSSRRVLRHRASSDERRSLGIEVGEFHRLLRDALDIVPELESATVIETRQGLRPATANLAPFIEQIGNRWFWSSGFYRHGVTLAPLGK